MTQSTPHERTTCGDVAIGGYSPVSYFEHGRAELGSPQYAVSYHGNSYYLTSADQANKFLANPEAYLPAHEGACAYGAEKGKTFPVDPTSFKIVDDRLLLFLKNDEVDACALWEQEHQQANSASCQTC